MTALDAMAIYTALSALTVILLSAHAAAIRIESTAADNTMLFNACLVQTLML